MISQIFASTAVVPGLLTLATAQEFPAPPSSDTTTILVGILEHGQDSVFLRFGFYYLHDKWSAFDPGIGTADIRSPDPLQAQTTWSVMCRGKNLGEIISLGLKQNSSSEKQSIIPYAERNLLRIEPARSVPTIGELGQDFSGWTDEPVYRPLVSVAHGLNAATVTWDTVELSKKEQKSLHQLYRKIVGNNIEICSLKSEVSDTIVNYVYSDRDILVGPSYGIIGEFKLTSLSLDPHLNHCDGPTGTEWSTYWFQIDPKGKVTQLGAGMSRIGDYTDMKLLDVGDFIGDGKIEAIFWQEKYDNDGYVLYYDSFKRSVECSWHYH